MNILNNIQDNNLYIGNTDFSNSENQLIKLKNAMVLYCASGRARLEIDMCQYELRPNTQLIILPNCIFQIRNLTDNFSATVVSFSAQLFWEASTPLNPMFFEQIRKDPCVQLAEFQERYVKSFISAMENCQLNEDNMYRQIIVRNIIQCFLLDVANMTRRFQLENQSTCTRPEILFKNFTQLLAEHCMYERKVNFYATKLCITPRYLSSAVRKVSGNTAKEMIDKHAILEIKTLLKTTNLTIQEISCQLGFPNQSFFSRYFTKYTGVTPIQYRKEI